MTNLKTIATTCLAVSGLAMAQDGSTSAFPTPASSSSSSAVSAPRTGLYGSVVRGNAASDNTVVDYTRRPTLIGDKQYFAGFGGADMGNAAFAIRAGSLNWFGAVTGPTNASVGVPNTLTVGAGSGTSWGGGLMLAVNRTYTQPTNNGTETTTYFDASGFGVFGDFNLGSSDVYGSIGWNTGLATTGATENSVLTKPAAGAEDDDNNHSLSIMGGWKKDATTEGTHSFNIEASYVMAMQSLQNPTVDATTTQLTIMPSWGYIVKSNSDFAVFVGANSTEQYTAFEQGSTMSLGLSPNISFQKQLGKGFEGFSGFSVTGSFVSGSDIPVDGASNSQLLTGGADVLVGLRWVKDNFAFEGSLKEALLNNGPAIVGGGAPGMFLEMGISVGI